MEVILRPLIRSNWAGVFKYKNCKDYISSYFTRSGLLYTGLRPEDGVDEATVTRLEKALDKDLRGSSEYWRDFFIIIGNKDEIIDTSDPVGELKYLFLKNHKRVANGIMDNKPTANYILVNKEAEAEVMNKQSRGKRKAMREFDKLSLTDMRKILRLYGHRSDNLSNELVENKLFELVERDPNKFFDKWVDNSKRETEFLIQEAIGKAVIRKNKSEYKYGTDTIGHTLEDAISYLDSPENRDLKLIISNEVTVKNK